MTPGNVTEKNNVSTEAILELARVAGPCISVYIPLKPAANEARENRARLKTAIQAAERRLLEKGIQEKQARELVEPMFRVMDAAEVAGDVQGMAIFRAPDFLRHFELPTRVDEHVVVANHFFIRPLLPSLESGRPFYVLALSQKHIRLLRCTDHTSEEVPLSKDVPKALYEDRHTDQPDHVQDNRITGGPSTGSMKGVLFSTSTDREAKDEYLRHFYKDVDKGIHALLKGETAPLVLAGVEYELAIYREVNSYPHLAEEAVQGAPDGLKGGELHSRALAAARSYFEQDYQKTQKLFDEQKGSDLATRTIKEIVRAAYEGRIARLILSESGQYVGNFDGTTFEVHGHKNPLPGDEDLLNAAALETILHGGQVFVVPAKKTPDGADAAAVMRYSVKEGV